MLQQFEILKVLCSRTDRTATVYVSPYLFNYFISTIKSHWYASIGLNTYVRLSWEILLPWLIADADDGRSYEIDSGRCWLVEVNKRVITYTRALLHWIARIALKFIPLVELNWTGGKMMIAVCKFVNWAQPIDIDFQSKKNTSLSHSVCVCYDMNGNIR